jgi:hypothetical protein
VGRGTDPCPWLGKQCGEHASIVPRPALTVVASGAAFMPTAPDAVRPAAYDTRGTRGVPVDPARPDGARLEGKDDELGPVRAPSLTIARLTLACR